MERLGYISRYITDVNMDYAIEVKRFALFNSVASVMKSLFFASAAVGLQVSRSPLSRYRNASVRCEAAAALP